jgi:hypothetical protein
MALATVIMIVNYDRKTGNRFDGADNLSKEPSLTGKAKYNKPPGTNLVRSDAFDIEHIIYFLQNKLP